MILVRISTGRIFSTIPQSKSQISPRLGIMLFLFDQRSELIARCRDLLLAQRTRINRRQPAKNLFYKDLLLHHRQLLKCHNQLRCVLAHSTRS